METNSHQKVKKKKIKEVGLKRQNPELKKSYYNSPKRGLCYFSNIPHGFEENELRKYCSQFGKVTGVNVPRNKKGNLKGYAFVEFLYEEVANIVAQAMNNYLMFYRLIKCKSIPPNQQKPWIFHRERNNQKMAELARKKNLAQMLRKLSKEEKEKRIEKRKTKIKAIEEKLASQGIDFALDCNIQSHKITK